MGITLPLQNTPWGHQGLRQVAFGLCEPKGHLERPSPSRAQASLSQEQRSLGCLYLSLLISVHVEASSVQSHEARAVDRLWVQQGSMEGTMAIETECAVCVCSVCAVCV